jgi:hypothetical protein
MSLSAMNVCECSSFMGGALVLSTLLGTQHLSKVLYAARGPRVEVQGLRPLAQCVARRVPPPQLGVVSLISRHVVWSEVLCVGGSLPLGAGGFSVHASSGGVQLAPRGSRLVAALQDSLVGDTHGAPGSVTLCVESRWDHGGTSVGPLYRC